MKLFYSLSLTAFLTACATTPTPKAASCGTAGPCVSLGNIAVFAEDAIADPILNIAQDGAALFSRYFGTETAPIAIVPGGEITSEMKENLEDAGYALSLPWISAADKQALVETSIRRQVMEQTKGVPSEQQEAFIKMALEKAGSTDSQMGEMSATEKGALTHELGHMWFIAAFKPANDKAQTGHGYGGWAPDWLDETAAVLLENDTLTDLRLENFKTMPAKDFYPLGEFLTMEHPALKSAQALAEKYGDAEDSGGSHAIFLSGEEGEAFLKANEASDPANFYTQARGFADYVIGATGDEQIFAKLAYHLSQGRDFESWLVLTKGLPSDLESLTKEWNNYLSAR